MLNDYNGVCMEQMTKEEWDRLHEEASKWGHIYESVEKRNEIISRLIAYRSSYVCIASSDDKEFWNDFDSMFEATDIIFKKFENDNEIFIKKFVDYWLEQRNRILQNELKENE